MPAPDVPPPPIHHMSERPLAVHLLPRLVDPIALRGAVVIMIDNLRASATITAALGAGAPWVLPTLTIEEARAAARSPDCAGSLLGGERGGVRPEGFDFGNSPAEYTQDRIHGRGIVFSTTNGTAALLHARSAAQILVGCMANAQAVVRAVAAEPRPVHILCAGTRDEVSFDDCLPAGLLVDRLLIAGRQLASDDTALLCLHAWREAASRGTPGILAAMRASRGGRNLVRLGMDADVVACAAPDVLDVVPVFDPRVGLITRAS